MGAEEVRVLNLFSGIGGAALAERNLGMECVGYVEWDGFCCRVLDARIRDGRLDDAPVFHCDIREFVRLGYARAYRGVAEAVSAGFPCQPFSNAGKRLGEADTRNMWPAVVDALRDVRPRLAFLENVPALLSSGYFGRILGDLAELGYDAEWESVSARAVDAPHVRERVWVVAYADESGCRRRPRELWPGWRGEPKNSARWPAEPAVDRVAHGLPGRVDRVRALGNAQVPAQAEAAWRLLLGRIGEQDVPS